MTGLVSVASAIAGGVLSHFASRIPAHVEALETAAGVLLIGGFALLGSALPILL